MRNLIKSDLYRMLRTGVFWIMLAVVPAMNAFTIIVEPLMGTESMTVMDGIYSSQNVFCMMMYCIMTSVFFTGDIRSGYIKNVAGVVDNRAYIAVSKFIAVIAAIFVNMTVNSAICIIISKIVFSVSFSFADFDFPTVISFLAMELLLYAGICAIVALFTTAVKSNAGGIGISMVLSARLIPQILGMIIGILEKNGTIQPGSKILNFFITPYVEALPMYMPDGGEPVIWTVCVGAAYLTVFLILSMIASKKIDVK